MMLAFDCSAEALSVALQAGACVLVKTDTNGKAAERLLPVVQDLLTQAGGTLHEVQTLVVGLGPGSFMGVRTACSVAQGLALGLGCTVKGVSSLLLLAEQARHALGVPVTLEQAPSALSDAIESTYLVARDARMQECYWARFAWSVSRGWRTLHAETVSAPADVTLHAGDTVVLLHEAAQVSTTVASSPNTSSLSPPAPWYAALAVSAAVPPVLLPSLDASALLRLAPSVRALQPHELLPLYVRDKVADTMSEQAQRRAQAQRVSGNA